MQEMIHAPVEQQRRGTQKCKSDLKRLLKKTHNEVNRKRETYFDKTKALA